MQKIPKKLSKLISKTEWKRAGEKQRQNWIDGANEEWTVTAECVKDSSLDQGDERNFMLNYMSEGTRGGRSENNIEVSFGDDGHIHFCGDPEDEQVYLYPEQVKLLRKLLRENK